MLRPYIETARERRLRPTEPKASAVLGCIGNRIRSVRWSHRISRADVHRLNAFFFRHENWPTRWRDPNQANFLFGSGAEIDF